jgi:excisionase family DNA binding protein
MNRQGSETREVMNIHQAAHYLGISSDTLYKYVAAHELPAFKLGNRWRFKRSLLDNWIEEKARLHLLGEKGDK